MSQEGRRPLGGALCVSVPLQRGGHGSEMRDIIGGRECLPTKPGRASVRHEAVGVVRYVRDTRCSVRRVAGAVHPNRGRRRTRVRFQIGITLQGRVAGAKAWRQGPRLQKWLCACCASHGGGWAWERGHRRHRHRVVHRAIKQAIGHSRRNHAQCAVECCDAACNGVHCAVCCHRHCGEGSSLGE